MKVWITHIGGYPGKYNQRIREEIQKNPPQIFIAGHSHILKVQWDKSIQCMHLNPGACGISGFHQMRTMLRFSIDMGTLKDLEVIELGLRGKKL
jgi:predicted phosphodiesterase